MEVLELKPIRNKIVLIYLIEKTKINSQLNDIDVIKSLIDENHIDFITIDINGDSFESVRDLSILMDLKALNIEYHLLDMPEYAYGYLYEEILKKEEQINDLLEEYQMMDDKDSFRGLNLKSWVDVLKKEVFQEKNTLEMKIRPQWIVKKILDLVKKHQNEIITLIHFAHEKTLSEMSIHLRDLHIETFLFDFNSVYNTPYLIIKQEESN
ncbi:MAG: hypothetical protein ACFE9M_13900 [Promethearchaeota archaeon]